MNPKVSALLFDFGGVLVDWAGIGPLLDLTEGRLSSEDARRYWLESVWVRKFEVGGCSPEAFAAGVIHELALRLSPAEFLAAFASWDRGPLPGAFELLEELKPRYPLYALSNNNAVHWHRAGLCRLTAYFQRCFVSFEIGLVKPDAAIFQHVKERVPEPAGQVLFLDDNPECVTAAQAAGFLGRQARGIEGVRRVLRELRLG